HGSVRLKSALALGWQEPGRAPPPGIATTTASGSYVLHLIPMSRPEIAVATSEPAVFHADFSPVTTAKPAKSGEVLVLRATGLGPTRPGINPGQPFPSDPLQEVNSPVSVTLNGKPADVINKIGWPRLVDTYRLDIRVPDGITAGPALLQLTAAWITR